MKGMIHNDILIAVTFKQACYQGKKKKVKKNPLKVGSGRGHMGN